MTEETSETRTKTRGVARQVAPHRETWEVDGVLLTNVHPLGECVGEWCTLHNPSDHSMRGWKMDFDEMSGCITRECSHGVTHIDPDARAWLVSRTSIGQIMVDRLEKLWGAPCVRGHDR